VRGKNDGKEKTTIIQFHGNKKGNGNSINWCNLDGREKVCKKTESCLEANREQRGLHKAPKRNTMANQTSKKVHTKIETLLRKKNNWRKKK